MSGKKLINKVENVVDEALDGLTMINPGIRRIRGHRVLLRETVYAGCFEKPTSPTILFASVEVFMLMVVSCF